MTCNTRLTRFSPTGQALTQKHGAAVFDLYTSAEQLEHAHLHTCSHSQLKKNIIHTWEQHTHSRIVSRARARKQQARSHLSGAQIADVVARHVQTQTLISSMLKKLSGMPPFTAQTSKNQ